MGGSGALVDANYDTSIPTFTFENESKDSKMKFFDFVVKEGNGAKGLADTGLTTIPPFYIHPPHERIDPKKTIDASPYLSSPIDLYELDGEKKDQVMESICAAAEKLGFFQVVNHGVPKEIMENVKRAAHVFFNLPPEKKAVYLKDRTPIPHVFYGTSSFIPGPDKFLEWKDVMSMTYMNDEEAMQFWPLECRDAALEYMRAANKVIHGLLNSLLKGLGVEVDETTLLSYMETKSVNMNIYPPCPSPELTVGIRRHSDPGALTFLLQDDMGGLYVKVEDKGWIEIPPVEGAIIINIGDTLEILSNGRYKSAEHRVIASSTKSRVSVPIFVSPRPSTMIGPLPGLAEKDGKTVFRELSYGEYTTYYFECVHHGKKNLDFARI